ncbi:MAG: hypothetical protein O2894_11100, partial [Planctomycetota bacterium]|nr:hypothetical protein [Planctomycetota bacterium]
MALLLALLALIVAGLAVLAAWRSHRSAHRLALEMVQLRDRLARAEAARAAAVARAAEQPALAVDDEGTRERLAHLEAAL